MKTNQCDHQRIDDFLQGESTWIDPDLAKHLETCDECRDYLDSQSADSDQWSEARELLRPTEFDVAGTAEFSVGGHVDAGVSSRPIQAVLDRLAPSEDPNRLGRLGSYEISGVIGVGGMGIVLKAIDPSLDRVVAVKVLAPHLANNDTACRRFAREAKAAAAVLHPNVIPIHGVASDAPVPYLVMSYIRGGSLQKRLESDGPLPLVEVLRIGSQIAAGLAAAHDQGLVHRDIKPENVLMEEGVERVTLTDFGLARAVDDNTVTQQGTIAGTPMYMSPEQAAGKRVDQQSDLFSLGSVLYSLCTGHPPYRDDSSYGVMRKIIDETPTPIETINPEIPAWLAGIIEKLMSKEPSDRYASAAEVHGLLEQCLSHVQHPASDSLPSNPRSAQSTTRRRSIMKAAVAALAMVLCTSFAWQWYESRNRQQDETAVRLPLGRLGGYVGQMMATSRDAVFLNLGEIGEDENYVVLEPTKDGILMTFPAFATSSWSRRQGKHADELREAARTLSLPLDETSEMGDDGTIKGVNFKIRVTGDQRTVAFNVSSIIERTFQVGSSEVCEFQYHNMPSTFSRRPGQQPQSITSDQFVAELKSLKRVYLGEREHLIFSIPPELAKSDSPYWDSNICCTDLRDIPAEVLAQIRITQTPVIQAD